jgi:hypothetical protein
MSDAVGGLGQTKLIAYRGQDEVMAELQAEVARLTAALDRISEAPCIDVVGGESQCPSCIAREAGGDPA